MKPKIYDCFTYFNEDKLLKVRLETLWDSVDYFIICESILTFTAKPKPINFNFEAFDKYKSKIRYLLIDKFPLGLKSAWDYEIYQRNFLKNGLKDASPNDLVMISDVDEIINPEIINNFNFDKYYRGVFQMKHYQYYLNNLKINQSGSPVLWEVAAITTYKNFEEKFKTMNNLRRYKSKGMFWLLKNKYMELIKTQIIPLGGWHFGWMGGTEAIISKLESFSHQKLNVIKYKNPISIEAKIKAGKDVFKRNEFYHLESVDGSFPFYIKNNEVEFEDWILNSVNP